MSPFDRVSSPFIIKSFFLYEFVYRNQRVYVEEKVETSKPKSKEVETE